MGVFMIEKDEIFLQKINSKEIPAFEELFNRYYNSLVLFAMKYVKLQEIAEDIVQDLFVIVWERDTVFLSFSGLSSFLYNSVRNNCLDHLKHKDVEKRYVNYLETSVENDDGLDDKVMKEELYRMLIETVNELPNRCRKIFESHMKGKTNEEIARDLGLSILTVKTQKKRAVRYLKERLGENYLIFF